MVNSIATNYHWPPSVLSGLFIDAEDMFGIVYWYNLIEQSAAEIKRRTEEAKNKKG
jgi:hypothetical protein